MLRKIWIVLGAVALISIAYATAFAVEEVQKPLVADESTGGAAEANTWTVCSSGCDFTSIQAAVDAASSGDIIELGAESFYESVLVGWLSGRHVALTIRGAGADRTHWHGGPVTAPVVALGSLSSLVVADMAITGGNPGISMQGSFAELVVSQCLIEGNHTGVHSDGGPGPAVGGTVTIEGSTIVNNEGDGVGFNAGDVRIINSTISDNLSGGIVFHPGDCPDLQPCHSGRLTIESTTISRNLQGGIIDSSLDGLERFMASRVIVADNFGRDCEVWKPMDDGSEFNLFSDDGCHAGSPTDLLMTNPLLLTLSGNGGPTPTHALSPGSPAIDAGGNDCLPSDQRGVARPKDGDGDGVAKCDIGAYEVDVLQVSVDIKSDGFPNSVNPYARGVLPVAILGSDTFDVAQIDVATLQFGPASAEPTHSNPGHLQDVDLDGYMDLVTHYRTQDTGIACGDESATLTGETLDGQPIEGTDSIQTVGCRETRRPAIWMKDQDRPDMPRREGPVNIERK